MATTSILLWLLFILGVGFTGYSVKQLYEQGFNEQFVSAMQQFIDNVKNNVEGYENMNSTRALIEQYQAQTNNFTTTGIVQDIYKALTNTTTNTIVVAKKYWDVFREFVSAVVKGLIRLFVSRIDETSVATDAASIIEAAGWSGFPTSISGDYYLQIWSVGSLLAGLGANVWAVRTTVGDTTASIGSAVKTFGLNSLIYVYEYEGTGTRYTADEIESMGLHDLSIYAENYYYLAPFKPALGDEQTITSLSMEVKVGTYGPYIEFYNQAGENVTGKLAYYHVDANGTAHYGDLATVIEAAKITTFTEAVKQGAISYSYWTSLGITVTGGSKFTDAATTFVRFWTGYTAMAATAFVEAFSIKLLTIGKDYVRVETEASALGDVYEKINTDETADVVTPGRVVDEQTGVIDGPISTGYTDSWVENYPAKTDETVAEIVNGQDVATVDTDTNSRVIADTDTATGTKDDVLDDTQTISNTIDDISGRDDAVIPTVVPTPTTSVTSSGFITLFNPSMSQLSQLNDILWSEDFITNFRKMITDPVDGIISLLAVPVQPSISGSQTVRLGNYDSGISMPKVSNQFGTVSCGSVAISETFSNFMDYSPYTKIELYLPFVGIVPLNTNEVMGASVSVTYNIDFLTGECIAQVGVSKKGLSAVTYVFNGNMAMQLPITGANYSRFYSSIVKGAAGIATAAATGGATLPLVVGNAALNAGLNSGGDVIKSGSISGNAGFLGGFTPYIIVSLPSPNRDSNYSDYEGNVVNEVVTLSSVSGYTRCKEIHLSSKTATGNELSEIESLLKTGVIL